MSDAFEFVAYVERSGSGNSFKMTFTKQVNIGDTLFLSVNETTRLLRERWFSARLYRLNKGITERQFNPEGVKEAEPEQRGFSLNLFEASPSR